MKRFVLLVSTLALIAAAFVSGVCWGLFRASLEENKLAIVNIDRFPNLDPQFREYLKARVYWNISMYYPAIPGNLIQKDWDRGAVDSNILGDIAAAKDPTVPILNWQDAINSPSP